MSFNTIHFVVLGTLSTPYLPHSYHTWHFADLSISEGILKLDSINLYATWDSSWDIMDEYIEVCMLQWLSG